MKMEWHEDDLEWIDDANIPVGCWESDGIATVVVFQPRRPRVLEMSIPSRLIPELATKAIDLMYNAIAAWQNLRDNPGECVYYYTTPTPPERSAE